MKKTEKINLPDCLPAKGSRANRPAGLQTGKTQVTVRFPVDVHRAFKSRTAALGLRMGAVMIELVTAWLKQKGNGAKAEA